MLKQIACNGYSLDFSKKTYIMGILNVTPDSFSDGGIFLNKSVAVDRAMKMVDDGADIIDIGGESTRPGSNPVTVEEEIRRCIPVIESVAKKINVPISIDTYKSEVAIKAIEAGASIVNDISGLRFDNRMSEVVSKCRVPVVIMHIKGEPRNMQINPTYNDLIREIIDYLREGINIAKRAGISEDMIIIDPGIGFGKTFDHNLQVINNLDKFTCLNRPILLGHSRKAFLGKILNDAPPLERLEGTEAVAAVAIMKGANILRVHDVKEIVKVARVVDAIKRERI